MDDGKQLILDVLDGFTGRDGEPSGDKELYILKSMWLMMLSEFEASIKNSVENYIDQIKLRDINNIHVCLLIRNFIGDKDIELTPNKIISLYKKNASEITYRNFTQDRVPKYKSAAILKLFDNLGLFLTDEQKSQITLLDSAASTRDSIAHGDIGVQITKRQLINTLDEIINIKDFLEQILIDNV